MFAHGRIYGWLGMTKNLLFYECTFQDIVARFTQGAFSHAFAPAPISHLSSELNVAADHDFITACI
jgi:hypothetical protein